LPNGHIEIFVDRLGLTKVLNHVGQILAEGQAKFIKTNKKTIITPSHIFVQFPSVILLEKCLSLLLLLPV
jgi:hypothetical protein